MPRTPTMPNKEAGPTRGRPPRGLPPRLLDTLADNWACSDALSALRRTTLSPREIWSSPKFRISWKLWAIRRYGAKREADKACGYRDTGSRCSCGFCAQLPVIRTTSQFLKLFPKPPARLLALCR